MVAPVISISADSSEESIGSSISLFILLDYDTKTKTAIIPDDNHIIIPIVPPVTLEVEVAIIALPAGVLDLAIHSDTETHLSKDLASLEHAPFAPGVSPFYDYDLDYESESSRIPSSLDVQETVVARWRASVMARSSSSDSLSLSPIHISPIEIAATPGMPAHVHVTPATVTSTIHTPCLTGGCNRVTVRKRFRHPLPVIEPPC
ncbi:hypothetical protein Tco_0570176 [Tanacetum coccineum]